MVDTAGIRETEDTVEKIGVERALKYAESADLVVYVVDASIALDENDREIVSFIGNKKKVVLLNKSDMINRVTEEDVKMMFADSGQDSEEFSIVKTSFMEGIGMDIFEETLKDMFFRGKIASSQEIVITNMRHREALEEVYHSLSLVRKSVEDGMPEDFYSIDLMDAYTSLGKITGEEVGDDLVEEIFSKFCMGK